MCGKRFSLASAFLLASLSLWSQSFDTAATYPVTGAQLNRLEKDLLTAQTELASLRSENAQLKADSTSKEKALTELRTQLLTDSKLWQTSQNEAFAREFWIGAGAFTVGGLGGALTVLLMHR